MNWFKKHKILTVVGLVILLIIIVSVAGSGNKSNTSSSSNPTKTTEAKTDDKVKVAKIGEAANDGKFQFTIASIECGKASAGTNQYLTKQAQGQFCFVNMTVKNIGTESQYFDSSSQYLFDASNAKYSADGTASIYANPEGSTFLNQINPGNSVNGIVVFDLPKDKTPVSAELHDSSLSGGVKINLQ